MLKILFFCALLLFSIFFLKTISYVSEKQKNGSSFFNLLFPILWALPELILLFLCYHIGKPEWVLSILMESFFYLLLLFFIAHVLFRFFIQPQGENVYFLSIFLYAIIVLNLTLQSENIPMFFGIRIPSLLMIGLFLLSLLFQSEKKLDVSCLNSWKSVFFFLIITLFLLFLSFGVTITKTMLLLFVLIPKGYLYLYFAKTKTELFPFLEYDGMLRFYLFGIFDLACKDVNVYQNIGGTVRLFSKGLIYLIGGCYCYFISKIQSKCWISFLLFILGCSIFLWNFF